MLRSGKFRAGAGRPGTGVVNMEYLLTVPGRLDCLNDYISAERTNRHKGAKMKADNGNTVAAAVRRCMRGVRIEKPVHMV